MKISFITTVFNEQDSIAAFLESLDKQTLKPDEIVIVDGGSTDKTLSVISNFQFLISKNKIKVISKKGNRSVGRNEAIKKATSDIIVVSDAGCILDKDWIKKITEPFKDKKIDVVSGYYYPITHNVFEKCLACYTCAMPDKIDGNNFLPSSRSVAFKKSAWKQVGGYPEYLETCEDLVFDKNLKKAGFKFVFQKEAVVYWPQRKNPVQAFFQFYNYAKGDGQALYFRQQTPFLYLRFLLLVSVSAFAIFMKSQKMFSALSGLLLLYILISIIKNYKYIKETKALYILPSLQIISDIAVFLGTTIGLIAGFKKMYNQRIK